MSILDEEMKKEQSVSDIFADIWSFCTDCQNEWDEGEAWCKQYGRKPYFHWAVCACATHAKQMRKLESDARRKPLS